VAKRSVLKRFQLVIDFLMRNLGLKDYENYYPNWNKDSLGYPKSPGLRSIEGGLNMGFNFNKNFSMNAAFAKGERQKKGAGSFL